MVYEIVLAYELRQRGLRVNRQVPISIHYKDMTFDGAFRADLILEEKVIVELKSVEQVTRLIRNRYRLTWIDRMQAWILAQLWRSYHETWYHRVVNGLKMTYRTPAIRVFPAKAPSLEEKMSDNSCNNCSNFAP